MTKHKYIHDGVTYVGLHTYNFGEMLLSWMVVGSCSEFLVTRTAFCLPKYKGEPMGVLRIRAHSETEVKNHLKQNLDITEDNGLNTYTFRKIIISSEYSTTMVDLCKVNIPRIRRVILD